MASLSNATPTQLADLMFRSGFPENTPSSNAFRMLAHSPSIGSAVLRTAHAILTDTDLQPGFRELVTLRIAHRCNGRYVWVQHAAIARSVGVSDVMIGALERGEGLVGLLGDRGRAAFALADELVDSCRCTDATLQSVLELFSPREVVELLVLIGHYRMMCLLMTALDIEVDSPFGVKVLEILRDTGELQDLGHNGRRRDQRRNHERNRS